VELELFSSVPTAHDIQHVQDVGASLSGKYVSMEEKSVRGKKKKKKPQSLTCFAKAVASDNSCAMECRPGTT